MMYCQVMVNMQRHVIEREIEIIITRAKEETSCSHGEKARTQGNSFTQTKRHKAREYNEQNNGATNNTLEQLQQQQNQAAGFVETTTLMVCKCCNSRSSCVLFLPCRHLCSCKDCAAFLDFLGKEDYMTH